MAKKTKEKKEIGRVNVNGIEFIKYDDGTSTMITTTELDADQTEELLGSESSEEDEDEDEEEEEKPKGKKGGKKEEPKGKGKKKPVDDDEDEEEDDDDEDSDDEDGEELTGEQLAEMDFEECEDLCDSNDLETDPDDFDEDDVEALRKAIAKELGLTLPKSKKEDKKGKKGKK